MTSKLRRLLWPGVMSGVMLVVLLGLGIWQLHRLAWKEAILAQLARAAAAPPVPLPATPSPFIKVAVTGRLLHDRQALYGVEVRDMPAGPALGAFLIEPLQRDGAAPVLVDLGWVPLQRTQPLSLPSGPVTVTGYVHQAEQPGWFAAHDDVVGRHFYTLDPAVIGAALGLAQVAPFILVALGPSPPAGLPIPAQHLPQPPNNHLQYALTWFGLAGVLVVVFLSWARKTLRT